MNLLIPIYACLKTILFAFQNLFHVSNNVKQFLTKCLKERISLFDLLIIMSLSLDPLITYISVET